MPLTSHFVLRMLKAAISVDRYPRYLVDGYIHFILQPIWRAKGIHLGKGVIWNGLPIIVLAPGSRLQIGDGCMICSRSSQTVLGVNHPVILRTLRAGAELSLGRGVRMSGTTICAAERVQVGDRCVIGANVTLADTDFHSLDPNLRSSPDDARLAKTSPVEIASDVFIGGGSTILKGVQIGRGAVIGAGSIVTRSVPEMTIVAGNPARIIGKVT